MLHTSEGILRYTYDKLIVEVDPGIASFYRAMIPKYHKVQRTRYPAHITVVREEIPNEHW